LGSPRRSGPGLFPSPCSRPCFDPHSLDIYSTPSSYFPLLSSSEFLRFVSSPGSPFGPSFTLPYRFFALSRPHSRAATFRESSQPSLRSVLRFSQPLDGLLRSEARRLISSRCHVQGLARSGASLPAQPPSLVGRSCPQAVRSGATHPLARAAIAPIPRLRGLHLREAAFTSA
jgi:hypothetical protein